MGSAPGKEDLYGPRIRYGAKVSLSLFKRNEFSSIKGHVSERKI